MSVTYLACASKHEPEGKGDDLSTHVDGGSESQPPEGGETHVDGGFEPQHPPSEVFVNTIAPGLGDFQSGLYVPLDNVSIGTTQGAEAVANGNIAISFADTTMGGTVDENDALESFDSGFQFHAVATLELSAETEGALNFSIPLPVVPLPSVQFGPTVSATPFIYSSINGSGTAEAGAHASVVIPMRTTVNFRRDTTGDHHSASNPRSRPEIGLPDTASPVDFDLELSFEAGIVFLVEIAGVPIGGPFITAEVGLDLGIAPLADPWWTLDATGTLRGGWTFLAPSEETPTGTELLTRNWNVAAAPGGLPIEVASSRWSRIFDFEHAEVTRGVSEVGGRLVVLAEGYGSQGAPWMAELDPAGSPEWETGAQSLVGSGMFARALSVAEDGDLWTMGLVNAINGFGRPVCRGDSSGSDVRRTNCGGGYRRSRTRQKCDHDDPRRCRHAAVVQELPGFR